MQPLLVFFVLLFPALLAMFPRIHPARPKPPAYVRVASASYHVVFVDRFSDPGVLGDVDYSRHVIRLRSGMNVQDEAEDLVHELLHAMLEDRGTREEMTGHEFIYLVAPKLVDTLYAQNPELGKYLDQASRSHR
jgi:hypothetical protein